MTKPWEETWRLAKFTPTGICRPDTDDPDGEDVLSVADVTMGGADRAQLAALATEMARLLLDAEWAATDDDYVSHREACPWCRGNKTHSGHKPDCRWLALMVKAGFR